MIPTWLSAARQQPDRELLEAETSRLPSDMRETNLLRDVAFNRHSMNDGEHVSPYDNAKIQIGADGIVVRLVQGLDEQQFKRTLSMATRATIGVDLSKPLPGDWESCEQFKAFWNAANHDGMDDMVQSGWPSQKMLGCSHMEHRKGAGYNTLYEGRVIGEDWDDMLRGGLQTALESQTVVFAVSGVSRTCTHQLVRSRRAAFHQQSQRASYYGDRPEVRMPESVWRNARARAAWEIARATALRAYRIACEEDISYQDARYILPEATTNYIMCEYNVKEFRDVYAYRGCSMFSWEIVHVMREMRRLLVDAHPFLEPHIKISCEKTHEALDAGDLNVPLNQPPGANSHTCTFQGWESVEGQCDFPWARQSNRTFLPSPRLRIGADAAKVEALPSMGELVDRLREIEREHDAEVQASYDYCPSCGSASKAVAGNVEKYGQIMVCGDDWHRP